MASVEIRQHTHVAPRDTLGEILERGSLRVPVQWQSPPQLSGEPPEFFIDPETGQPGGIVITLSTLMAEISACGRNSSMFLGRIRSTRCGAVRSMSC